jgi:hypothetical protein
MVTGQTILPAGQILPPFAKRRLSNAAALGRDDVLTPAGWRLSFAALTLAVQTFTFRPTTVFELRRYSCSARPTTNC